MPKKLSALLEMTPLRILNERGVLDISITGITFDSRQVEPGFVFVPLVGVDQDGHAYIDAAIEQGAVAVVGVQPLKNCRVPYVQVENTHNALAHLAAAFYDLPASKLTVIGVTGTDGKTTTCNLIYHILKQAGKKVGLISTVNAIIGDKVVDTGFHVTTPDATDLQRYLALMVADGLTHVVIEATSHGLAQDRVAACEFDIGVVTNITHEHMDFHRTYDNYFAAKAKLFTSLSETRAKSHGAIRLAILNKDDSSFEPLKKLITGRSISYGVSEEADVKAIDLQQDAGGLHFTCKGMDYQVRVDAKMTGIFNVANILAAMCTAVEGLQIDPQVASQGILSMPPVPGRMENIDMGQDFCAIVDFAHTPNALHQALAAARAMTDRKVIAVFGSAGLRDRTKRGMMAEISSKLADITILTAEDPRTESLKDILEEMATAASQVGGKENVTFWRIPDRGDAIRKAIRLARQGDVVIACGKGHERSMCFGTTEYPWDDRTAMKAALSELLGKPGDAMPELPTS